MPRPHYPAQGGPHRAAWNPSEARKARRAGERPSRPGHTLTAHGSGSTGASASHVAEEACSRVHATASTGQDSEQQPRFLLATGLQAFVPGPHNNRAVLGISVLLCLTAAVFAIAAILGHG